MMKCKSFVMMAASVLLATPTFAQDISNANQSGTPAVKCPQFANRVWPVNTTIQARITESIDSSQMKPGKQVFAKVLYPVTYGECSLTDEAILYGHVTAAASSENPNSSELGLVFDHADCTGQERQKLHLRLIALAAPPDQGEMLHQVLPSEVAGGVQPLPVTSSEGIDDNLSHDKYPVAVRPGLVVRMPNKATLEPDGGPDCSARISSSGRSIQLVPGTELILTLETVTTSK